MDYDSLLMCLMYPDDLLMSTLMSTFDGYIKQIKSAPGFPGPASNTHHQQRSTLNADVDADTNAAVDADSNADVDADINAGVNADANAEHSWFHIKGTSNRHQNTIKHHIKSAMSF